MTNHDNNFIRVVQLFYNCVLIFKKFVTYFVKKHFLLTEIFVCGVLLEYPIWLLRSFLEAETNRPCISVSICRREVQVHTLFTTYPAIKLKLTLGRNPRLIICIRNFQHSLISLSTFMINYCLCFSVIPSHLFKLLNKPDPGTSCKNTNILPNYTTNWCLKWRNNNIIRNLHRHVGHTFATVSPRCHYRRYFARG